MTAKWPLNLGTRADEPFSIENSGWLPVRGTTLTVESLLAPDAHAQAIHVVVAGRDPGKLLDQTRLVERARLPRVVGSGSVRCYELTSLTKRQVRRSN